MKPIEIESWALRILENVKNKSQLEDSLVELKSVWPEAKKIARRIAGHANAARGENVLWLIGVDEEKGIVGTTAEELSTWFSQVQSSFDGVAPNLESINVSFDGKTIVALCFDTSRAPFVVKNPTFGISGGGAVEWEVPWREATKTRSATRNDLITILLPQLKVPTVEILDAIMGITLKPGHSIAFCSIIYIIPRSLEQIIFPAHKCEAAIFYKDERMDASEIGFDTPFQRQGRKYTDEQNLFTRISKMPIKRSDSNPSLIDATGDEAIVRGAGKILIEGRFSMSAIDGWSSGITLNVILVEANSGIKIPLTMNLVKDTTGGLMVWDRK